MRIHTKLFLLLLVIAVLPLVALTWRGQRATENLGQTIAESGKAALMAGIETQLRQAVDYSSDVLAGRQRLVELALRVQAAEVERLLAAPVRPGDPRPIYLSTAYEDPATWPPGTQYSLERSAISDGRKVEALAISLQHQAFFIPEGASPRPDLMRRLAPLDGVYGRLNAEHQDLFYWQYTSLDDGLHSVYPGHGGYPVNYDPRDRVWYQAAVKAADIVWIPALLDASTRRLLVTAAMPVRGAEGEIVGVTGIDIDILTQLAAVHARIKLGDSAESFIVRVADESGRTIRPGGGDGKPQIRVVASSSATAPGGAWDAEVAEPVLLPENPEAVNLIVNDLMTTGSGMRHMAYNGAEAIWVYRQLDRVGNALVYVAPVGDIERIADDAQDSIRRATMQQIRLAGIASVLLIALVGIAGVVAARSVSGPLRALAATAKDLAAGNLEARAPVGGNDEVGELAGAFNAMVPQLRSHIEVQGSLSLAREVQQKLLPKTPPQINGFDVAGLTAYSEAIGGDYYDFIEMTTPGDTRLGIVVGDVTGHGIPAALTMTSVRALVRSHSHSGEHLLPVMQAINRHLTAEALSGIIVTLVYLVLDPETRSLRWISAGHGPILFYNAETVAFEELAVVDIPLGVQADWQFHENGRSEWPAHGVLVIGTDGIWETRDAEGRMFGRDNLIGVIRATAHLPAAEISKMIVERLAEFRGSAPQGDDITVIVVKFLPKQP